MVVVPLLLCGLESHTLHGKRLVIAWCKAQTNCDLKLNFGTKHFNEIEPRERKKDKKTGKSK